ncbi:MAG: AraC family transcriptional regulator N-terminal domain-containing protein, partial [Hansschlegelia sp.]
MDYRTSAEDDLRRQSTAAIRTELADRISALVGDREELHTAVPGFMLAKRTSPVPATPYLYEPSLAMIVQGRKHVILGRSSYWYDESLFLLTAVDLPTITEVLEASADAPYLSIVLKLDLLAARRLIAEIDLDDPPGAAGGAMAVGPATEALFDVIRRLIDLLSSPKDIRILGDLLQRELLYCVLTSPAGARLRQIVRIGTQSHRISQAVDWLRENYVAPLRVEELALRCGMGLSSLHHHF